MMDQDNRDVRTKSAITDQFRQQYQRIESLPVSSQMKNIYRLKLLSEMTQLYNQATLLVDGALRQSDYDINALERHAQLLEYRVNSMRQSLEQQGGNTVDNSQQMVNAADEEDLVSSRQQDDLAGTEDGQSNLNDSDQHIDDVDDEMVDERYVRFIRLHKVGASITQLQQQISVEGLDVDEFKKLIGKQ
ncbi:hypothetical protein MP228_007394 [Amoeboaphelidium protococcarum]|nr:hypothetical protein MP228_007394 [Amoeboaphelidium protococcarum]